MDIGLKLLLWAHFVGLAMGGAPVFGHLVLGGVAARSPEARPHLMPVGKGITMIGRAGIAILILTGIAMTVIGFDVTSMPWTFWVKMLLVVLAVANIIYAGLLAKRAAGGDMAAAARLPMLGKVALVVVLLIVFFAVLTF